MYVNRYYSDEFRIQSGVAQGCPLSPLLFLVVAEALRVSVDMEKGLEGVKIGTSYYKLSQFADDTTIIMENRTSKQGHTEMVQGHGYAGKHSQTRRPGDGDLLKKTIE